MKSITMRILNLIIFVFLSHSAFAQTTPSVFNIWDYGATGKKEQKVTKEIQKALDDCYANGGGQVYFPPGDYLAGTLVIKSNTSLYLEAGATLRASRDEADYQTDFIVYKKNDSGKEGDGATPVFLYAKNAENISILGSGTIDGQATRTYEDLKKVDGFIADITENARKSGIEMKMYYKVKPYTCLVFLESCKNVRLRDVTLTESTDWTLHFKWCERVYLDNMYIYSSLEAGVNADGIDVDGSKDVVIQICVITTGDDAIVLKSTQTNGEYYSCENVTVTNCVLRSTSTALKLGTESFGDFRYITFNNCVIRASNRGLSIVVRDGATVEKVLFSNIVMETDRKHFNWWGNADPIWLVVKKRQADSKVGIIKDVVFENVIAKGQGTSKLEGFAQSNTNPARNLENITLRNVQFQMEAEDFPDKRATHAFAAHHVQGLRLEDIRISWDTQKTELTWASGMYLKNIADLYMDNCQLMPGNPQKAALHFQNVQNAYLDKILPLGKLENFIYLEGEKSQKLLFKEIDPQRFATKRILKANNFPSKALQMQNP